MPGDFPHTDVVATGAAAGGAPADETRFPFGRNWRSFLRVLDDARVQTATESLVTMLERPDLGGKIGRAHV